MLAIISNDFEGRFSGTVSFWRVSLGASFGLHQGEFWLLRILQV
jgi:hypothetical protein